MGIACYFGSAIMTGLPFWRACHFGRAILTGSRHGAALEGRSSSVTLAVPLRQGLPPWQRHIGGSATLAAQDIVVRSLQNDTKSSICGLQNAKSAAKCGTYQWGRVYENACFSRLKNFLTLARYLHYIEARKKRF